MFQIILVLCHALNGVPMCVEEVAASFSMERQYGCAPGAENCKGSTIIQNLTPLQQLTECRERAQVAIADWMTDHPIYHTWTLAGWTCAKDHADRGRA